MTTNDGQQSAGDKVVSQINDITNVIGTLVPTIGAIGGMVRLIAKAVKPSDAQKAQPFQDAITAFDAQVAQLNAAVAGFEQAKTQAAALQAAKQKATPSSSLQEAQQGQGPQAQPHGVGAVDAMTTQDVGVKPSNG
jgi:hypothetical protein